MANVLHFATDDMPKTACGAQLFLCDDYTDEQRYVDCKRCKATKLFRGYDPRRFTVDVWDHEGDVVESFRSVTADEVDRIREDRADDPAVTVTVEETR